MRSNIYRNTYKILQHSRQTALPFENHAVVRSRSKSFRASSSILPTSSHFVTSIYGTSSSLSSAPFRTVASSASSTRHRYENFVASSKNANMLLTFVAASSLATMFSFFTSSDEITSLDAIHSREAPSPSEPSSATPHETDNDDDDTTTTLVNWSGTHTVTTSTYYEPETTEELERIVRNCHRSQTPIRPLGSALSPNAIGFKEGGMISLSNLDKIVKVDEENKTVTVQAGARVSQVIEALRKHNLTLPNLASIAEQQMGGFTQVGAHGTGASIPPVDDFVISMKLVTPSAGTLELSDPSVLFYLARVGLGSLGIVSELTMKCIPSHKLVEHTYVLTRKEAKDRIVTLLKTHKHIRYMWIPYEDAVVVVTNDPEGDLPPSLSSTMEEEEPPQTGSDKERFRPLIDLLRELTRDSAEPYTEERLGEMGFGELRDSLLAIDPLDVDHVKRINKAEAEFWRRSEGYRTLPSDQLLQFDCGGQQWVWEVCFPTGTYSNNNGNDMLLMENLLQQIEQQHIPAPAPIEQRWSASSKSLMSPAYGHSPDGLHSWVGIIMYLPADEDHNQNTQQQRNDITNAFRNRYCRLFRSIGQEVNATSHWAKLELPETQKELEELKQFLKGRYPVTLFRTARHSLDPMNLLSNDLINVIFGESEDDDGRAKRMVEKTK